MRRRSQLSYSTVRPPRPRQRRMVDGHDGKRHPGTRAHGADRHHCEHRSRRHRNTSSKHQPTPEHGKPTVRRSVLTSSVALKNSLSTRKTHRRPRYGGNRSSREHRKVTMILQDTEHRDAALVSALVAVWERSVRATHTFLTDDEINRIKQYVPQAIASTGVGRRIPRRRRPGPDAPCVHGRRRWTARNAVR